MEVLKLFAPYGPGWLGGAALTLIAFYFGKQFLEEYKRQNERKGDADAALCEAAGGRVVGCGAHVGFLLK